HRALAARMSRLVAGLLLVILVGGCASLRPWPWEYSPELVKADRLVEHGDYAAAVAAYAGYPAKHGSGTPVRIDAHHDGPVAPPSVRGGWGERSRPGPPARHPRSAPVAGPSLQ